MCHAEAQKMSEEIGEPHMTPVPKSWGDVDGSGSGSSDSHRLAESSLEFSEEGMAWHEDSWWKFRLG